MTSTATSTKTSTATGTEISAPRGTQAITLTRDFDAPAALVFRCHTDPVLLAQWLGPRRLTMTVEDRDAMIASGMEEGVRDGDERLTELLERLQREG